MSHKSNLVLTGMKWFNLNRNIKAVIVKIYTSLIPMYTQMRERVV